MLVKSRLLSKYHNEYDAYAVDIQCMYVHTYTHAKMQ